MRIRKIEKQRFLNMDYLLIESPTMILQFTEKERNYIVNNPETDLLLTEVGMRLIEKVGDLMTIEATEAEFEEFAAELRYTLTEKVQQNGEVETLRRLARRLLPEYHG